MKAEKRYNGYRGLDPFPLLCKFPCLRKEYWMEMMDGGKQVLTFTLQYPPTLQGHNIQKIQGHTQSFLSVTHLCEILFNSFSLSFIFIIKILKQTGTPCMSRENTEQINFLIHLWYDLAIYGTFIFAQKNNLWKNQNQ